MTKYLPLNKVLPLMLVYCIITVIGMYHHELWFDEVQHWLIARDSKSILELASNNRYDVHVLLWKTFLFIITHFISDNPFAMQVLHLIIINIAVFIFLRYAPFNLLAKVLIIFGYYFIFEYSILCRNYALGILFLFIVCTLLSKPDKNLITIGILLLLMCNTHVFFIFASVGVFLYLLYYNYEQKSLNGRFLILALFFLAGIITAAIGIQNVPVDSTYFHPGYTAWLTMHNVSFAIHGLDKGFISFPPLHDPIFWNRHMFEGWSSFIKVPISILFLVYPVWVIKDSQKALIFYATCSLFLLLFLTMSQMNGSRYYGMFFIYFIISIWLADFDGVNILKINNGQKVPPGKLIALSVFYLVLLIQLCTGVYIYEQDYTRPFSQGENVVKFLKERQLDNEPIVVDGYNSGSVLSAYLGRDIYFVDADLVGGSCLVKKEYFPAIRKSLNEEIMQSKYLTTLKEYILISNRSDCDSVVNNINTPFHFDMLNSFQGAIISSENYYLFKVVRK